MIIAIHKQTIRRSSLLLPLQILSVHISICRAVPCLEFVQSTFRYVEQFHVSHVVCKFMFLICTSVPKFVLLFSLSNFTILRSFYFDPISLLAISIILSLACSRAFLISHFFLHFFSCVLLIAMLGLSKFVKLSSRILVSRSSEISLKT